MSIVSMMSTNSSDLSLNKTNNKVMCRQSKHSKRRSSHPKSCSNSDTTTNSNSLVQTSLSTSSSSSSFKRQTIRRKGNQMKGKYVDSCQISSIVKTKLLNVKNSAKNVYLWTSSLTNGVNQYFKSIHNWTYYHQMSYSIELIARCCLPWIKSNKQISGDDKCITRLPYKAIARKNSRNQENYQNINNNNNNNGYINRSSNYSSYYLNSMFNMYSPLLSVVLLISFICRIAEACSSRSTPKPRPPSPTTRPNITFQTYACPEAYAKWYCLNGATCFSVRIGESILYNCECADGYMGQRCEFKDLDGSYLPSREKVLVETASIAGGVTLAVILMVVIILFYYTYLRHKNKEKRLSNCTIEMDMDMDMDQLTRNKFSRIHSLRKSCPSNISLNYGQQYCGPKRDQYEDIGLKHIKTDLECGTGEDNLANMLRPVIITCENCDQNHDK